MITYITLFSKGILVTLGTWLLICICSFVIGTLLGIASCKKLSTPLSKSTIQLFGFIARGIPAYVQILIGYFIIPHLIGINFSALTAGCIALIFCSSGYMTEIVRSGINSVPNGQWQACKVLGYPLRATLIRIILPQAFKTTSPAIFGECEQILKSTSLLATIGITETTRTGMNIISRELNPIPVYITIALIYLTFSALVITFSTTIERKLNYDRA